MPFNVLPVLAGMVMLAVVTPAPAFAQLTTAIEGIGSRITYDGGDGLSALLIRPEVEWSTPSASIAANGGFAQFASGGWTLQGAVAASSFTPFSSRLGGELAGDAIGSTHQDGTTAGGVLGRGRLHWMATQGGVWIGGALGQAWNGIQWQADRKVDVGVWLRMPAVTLVAAATPTWLGEDLRFFDAELTAGLVRERVELTASGGIRHWSQPVGAAGSTWGGASAALWFSPHLALVAAGGSYPTDYGQGLLSGTYLSLGLRLASRPSGRVTPARVDARMPAPGTGPGPVGTRPPAVVVSTFELQRGGGGQQTFVLRAPGAQRIDLMGDFTEWQTVPLTRAGDGTWRVTLDVSPGPHRMNLRVDGGQWGVPPGFPAITDEFGGMVAILQIVGP
jgi:Glycogen recognition site of AMP-activated protein kinase